MYKRYNDAREGWVVYDSDGNEVQFIYEPKKKKKNRNGCLADLEGWGCILVIILFVIMAIAAFATTHPVISVGYVILLVLCIAWRNKPGTMGTVSKILKFVLPVAAIVGVYFGFKGM